jgi:hypothetical protein
LGTSTASIGSHKIKTKSELITNKPVLSARAWNGLNLFRVEINDAEGEEYLDFGKTEALLTG